MELWGIPVLTGYSYEDFPTRTTQSRLLRLITKKALIPHLKFHITYACDEDQDAELCQVAPDLLKALYQI